MVLTDDSLVDYTTRSLGLSVRGVMVGRESLDLEDSLRVVDVDVVVVEGAPSWASFLVAPLGPDSRDVVASEPPDFSALGALDDDDVDDDDDEDDDAVVTTSSATTISSATTVSDSLEFSAGLEEGFQVGLWRPLEGDLVGEPAKLR